MYNFSETVSLRFRVGAERWKNLLFWILGRELTSVTSDFVFDKPLRALPTKWANFIAMGSESISVQNRWYSVIKSARLHLVGQLVNKFPTSHTR